MAARVVACDNDVLRNLVRETSGCSEQQLNSYVSFALRPAAERAVETRNLGHHLIQIETCVPLPADKTKPRVTKSRIKSKDALRPKLPHPAAPNPLSRPHIPSDRRCHDRATPHIPSDKILADLDGSESTTTGQDPTDLESHRSFDSGSAASSENQSSDFNGQQGPSMSCEEAAGIISSLRVMDGPRDIREQLGCTSVGSCNVNTMKVFQVVGEAI